MHSRHMAVCIGGGQGPYSTFASQPAQGGYYSQPPPSYGGAQPAHGGYYPQPPPFQGGPHPSQGVSPTPAGMPPCAALLTVCSLEVTFLQSSPRLLGSFPGLGAPACMRGVLPPQTRTFSPSFGVHYQYLRWACTQQGGRQPTIQARSPSFEVLGRQRGVARCLGVPGIEVAAHDPEIGCR